MSLFVCLSRCVRVKCGWGHCCESVHRDLLRSSRLTLGPGGCSVRNPGQATVHNTVRPLSPTAKIVHFCWTHNITFKIGKMKGYKSLYVSEECLHNWESCVDTPSNEWQDDVCLHTDLPPMARSRAAWLKAH